MKERPAGHSHWQLSWHATVGVTAAKAYRMQHTHGLQHQAVANPQRTAYEKRISEIVGSGRKKNLASSTLT